MVLGKLIPNNEAAKIKFYHANFTLFLQMASHNPENCKKVHTADGIYYHTTEYRQIGN